MGQAVALVVMQAVALVVMQAVALVVMQLGTQADRVGTIPMGGVPGIMAQFILHMMLRLTLTHHNLRMNNTVAGLMGQLAIRTLVRIRGQPSIIVTWVKTNPPIQAGLTVKYPTASTPTQVGLMAMCTKANILIQVGLMVKYPKANTQVGPMELLIPS